MFATRRWCLTGTPIQNRLEDLLSLLKFLHFEPFCQPAIFRKYILDPLSHDNLERVKTLHILLRAICLRRDQKYLQLPEPCYEEVKLTLSREEKRLYNDVLKGFQDDLDTLVSSQSKTSKYAVLFTMILKLRRLCNHGSKVTMEELPLGITPEMDSDTLCDYCQGHQQENLAILNKNKDCPECGRIVLVASPNPHPFVSSQSRSLMPVNSPVHLNSPASEQALRTGLNSASICGPPSTKLRAVLENLKSEPPGSKR